MIVQFPLSSGIEEGSDPKTLPPGRLLSLVNAAWTKDGRLDKRDGTKGLPKTNGPTTAKRLVTRDGEICVIDGSSLFSWSPVQNQWINVGRVPETALTWDTVLAPSDGAQSADIGVTTDGHIVLAWVAGDPTTVEGSTLKSVEGTLYVRVIDATTGVTIASHVAQAPATFARVLANGTGDWVIIYNSGANIILMGSNFGESTLRADGEHTFVGYCPFDACAYGTTIALAYSVAGVGIRLYSYDFTGTQILGNVAVRSGPALNVSAIGMHGTVGEHLYIVWGEAHAAAGSTVFYVAHDPATLAQTLARVTLDATASMYIEHVGCVRIPAAPDAAALFAWSVKTTAIDTTYANGALVTKVGTYTGVKSGTRRSFYTKQLSRPFVLNGLPYIFCSDWAYNRDAVDITAVQNPFPGTHSYLAQVETTGTEAPFIILPHRGVGHVDHLDAGGWTQGCAPAAPALSATAVLGPLPFLQDAPVRPWSWLQGVRAVSVKIGASMPVGAWDSVELAGEAHLAGGLLETYDGMRPFSYGFPRMAPIGFNGTKIDGVGAMVAGDYFYATVPVFRSAAGIFHRGPSSMPLKFTSPATGRIRLAILPETLGGKLDSALNSSVDTQWHIEVYRTEVGKGSLHKRTIEPTDSVVIDGGAGSPEIFTDTAADSSISNSGLVRLAERPLIYTTSEYDDYAPPSNIGIHLHRHRLFVIAGDGRTVWFSKDVEENPGTAPGFNPSAILTFDEALVGMRTLDQWLVYFAEGSIFADGGAGPAVNGDGSDYAPFRVQTDKGCVNARSLVSTPIGIMYESPVGISLLSRKLEVSWIGKAVQDRLAAFPVITSATLDAAQNKVRFTCNSADGLSGVVLVFDYNRGQWSTFKYWDSDAGVASTPIADAIIWNGTWTFVTPGGKVYVEDATTSLDDGAHWVEEDWELAEVDATGPLGYQRVRRCGLLGERVTDCDVRLRIAVNGSAAYDQDHTWTSDVVAAIGTANLTRVVKTQKNGSIRMRFTDAAPTGLGAVVGTGKGVNVSAIGFDIEPKAGINRRAAKAVA